MHLGIAKGGALGDTSCDLMIPIVLVLPGVGIVADVTVGGAGINGTQGTRGMISGEGLLMGDPGR